MARLFAKFTSMSRLGKLPIPVPQGVQVELNLPTIRVKGPKGEHTEVMPKGVTVKNEAGVLTVTPVDMSARDARAKWGLARQLLANAVHGVAHGYQKKLELVGIGFKVQLEGKDLVLNLGFSHPVHFKVPTGVVATIEKNTVTVSGASKQQVGQVAAELRGLKPPEPYKGKGIKYSDEVVRRKAGKVVKAAGAK